MQRNLEFKAPAAETGGRAAGNIVPFQQQHIEPFFGQGGCRRKTAVSGADYNNIIGFHQVLLIPTWPEL
jgi:hypothetical protein